MCSPCKRRAAERRAAEVAKARSNKSIQINYTEGDSIRYLGKKNERLGLHRIKGPITRRNYRFNAHSPTDSVKKIGKGEHEVHPFDAFGTPNSALLPLLEYKSDGERLFELVPSPKKPLIVDIAVLEKTVSEIKGIEFLKEEAEFLIEVEVESKNRVGVIRYFRGIIDGA